METNSQIYTTSILGLSSGQTAQDLASKNTEIIETAIFMQGTVKMNNVLPRVPSNQNIAKDKP